MTNREYRLKGPYVVLSFILLLFCVLCGVIANSVLKADLALFRRPDLEKDKNKEQSSPEKYYSPGRNTEVKQTLIYISAGKPAN